MKLIKVLVLAMAVCLLCLGASNGFAKDIKIGVLQTQTAIFSCDAGKAAKGRLDEKMKELQASFTTEEEGLKKLQDEIKKKSSAWSEEKKTEKVREFQKSGREYQAKTEDARLELKKLEKKELEPILKALEKVVKKFGEDKGFSVILEYGAGRGVLWAKESIDITDSVVKELNTDLAKK